MYFFLVFLNEYFMLGQFYHDIENLDQCIMYILYRLYFTCPNRHQEKKSD